jgi:hypothetical protein
MSKVGGLVLPETSPALLAQRTPGETDLRIFTAEVIPAGRHRVDPRRPGLRVVRNRRTGRAALRTSLPAAARDVDLFAAARASR